MDRRTFRGDENSRLGSSPGILWTPLQLLSLLQRAEPDFKYIVWRRVVECYTQRKLTKEHDRLEAISGVAASFQPLLDDRYTFGLWRMNLLQDLVWTVSFRHESLTDTPSSTASSTAVRKRLAAHPQGAPLMTDVPNSQVPQPQLPSYAPSWSWASVTGPINFIQQEPNRMLEHMPVLIHIGSYVCGKNPFGSGQGYLVAEALLVPMNSNAGWKGLAILSDGCPSVDVFDFLPFLPRSVRAPSLKIHLDVRGVENLEISVDDDLSFFLLGSCKDFWGDSSFDYWGLLLKAVNPESHTFMRVGFACLSRSGDDISKDLVAAGERRPVTIV